MDTLIDFIRQPRKMLRVVVTGSSNTGRSFNIGNRWSWPDWLDSGIHWTYGRCHYVFNTGISGQTSRSIRQRFETDALILRPNIIFITCGGNDCSPSNGVSLDEFRENLTAMTRAGQALDDCVVILQTYYSADIEKLNASGQTERAAAFPKYMQAVRDVAADTGAYLFDHLKRWEPMRLTRVDAYRSLMEDDFHLNAKGQAVFGLDILSNFGVNALPASLKADGGEANAMRQLLDELGG
ncbi:MAG: SGNH/GDSL hydrolase family protein [Planctomycetota bacterium]